MPKFKTFRTDIAIDKLKKMVEGGSARLLHEHSQGYDRLFVLSRGGASMGLVHPERVDEMKKIAQSIGSGDGLFPGFSQTTRLVPESASA